MSGNAVEKGRLVWMGSTKVPLTFVLTSDLARYLAAAVVADVTDGERIDIGWDRPVSISDAGDLLGQAANKKIKVTAIPSAITRLAGRLIGPLNPMMKDMAAMFGWFDTGKYVADTTRQTVLFGTASSAEAATSTLADQLKRDPTAK